MQMNNVNLYTHVVLCLEILAAFSRPAILTQPVVNSNDAGGVKPGVHCTSFCLVF